MCSTWGYKSMQTGPQEVSGQEETVSGDGSKEDLAENQYSLLTILSEDEDNDDASEEDDYATDEPRERGEEMVEVSCQHTVRQGLMSFDPPSRPVCSS